MIDVISEKWLHRDGEPTRLRLRVALMMESLRGTLRAGWEKICAARLAVRARSERRSLRVAESVSLGDKRSVHLIEVEGQRFLLGSSAAGVTLLSALDSAKATQLRSVKELMFADVMENCASAKTPKRRQRVPAADREAA